MAFDPKVSNTPPAAIGQQDSESQKENKANKEVSKNPKPKANGNIKDKDPKPGNSNQVGGEITDGEDG